MTGTVVSADGGGFIWLIVGAFWIIAQISGAAAKKKQPPRPSTEATDGQAGPKDPLAELFRELAGTDHYRVEAPVFIEEEQPQPAVRPSASPWKPGEIEALPDIQPLRHEPPAPEPVAKPVVLPEPDIRPTMSAFRNSVPSIKLPAMNRSFQGSATAVQKAPELGKILSRSDRSSLRRAMLGQIIFSPPKALEPPVKP